MQGETIGGRYELVELVGSGGMSSVWRARDTLLDRDVALKVLHTVYVEDAEYVERFRREALAVARLAHPNVVTVIDRGEDGGRQFIVFEYVDGEDLKQVVERRGPLPQEDVVAVGLEIARGLAFAHERGIVHRDVKPQNVLLNGDGRAKVTDFGIARSLDVERGMTQTGTVLGSSSYIAPEQASGERVDAQSDVYSLGCVLFELLTGDVPFPGENFVAVALQHLNERAPAVASRRRDVHPRLGALVDAMLAKDHRARPTMQQVVRELESLRDGSGATLAATRVVARRPRHARTPWVLVFVLLGVLAAAAAGVAALTLARDDGGGEETGQPRPVKLAATRSYDPEGDNTEHDSEVVFATDGDRSTAWSTSTYRFGGGSLGKPGVGIVLATPAPRELRAITVTTGTPGFRAEIRVGDRRVSPSRVVDGVTTFRISEGTRSAEWILWITHLGDNARAQVNDVRATAAS